MNKLTDKELFIQFYKQVGINMKENINDDGNSYFIFGNIFPSRFDEKTSTSDNFQGYGDFYSDIEFTPEGNFIKQGFWE